MVIGSQWRVIGKLYRPSMSANTDEDALLKTGLIDDVMTVLDIEKM